MGTGSSEGQNPQESRIVAKREADWTLVQLTGGSSEYRGSHVWRGRWAALNQRGEVYVYGDWTDCWESAKHWARVAPPRGAAYGEQGTGWRGPVPGLGGLEP